jgi:type II secretory pathway pseudopilin PulG
MTLLEVLLVVSLLAVLAAFAWPNFEGAHRAQHLNESAARLRALVAMCRAEAMNESRIYWIVIRADGSLQVRRQLDPLTAPHLYVPVQVDWARQAFLLDDVWVESVVPLLEGPPPVVIKDEVLQPTEEKEPELIPVQQFEEPIFIEFQPDGTSDSLRWVLRDALGSGVQMTLDGRLGRVTLLPVEALREDAVERPPALKDNPKEEAEVQVAPGRSGRWR